MKVRITQIDGALPNLALMRLGAFHRAHGDEVRFFDTHDGKFPDNVCRGLDEPEYDRTYGSAIFTKSRDLAARYIEQFPDAIVGGTGIDNTGIEVEEIAGEWPQQALDYSLYSDFRASIGFTQRGCRLNCGFCGVRPKEGREHTVATIADIYRGEPYPRWLHLLDNDFFGPPEWRDRIAEIRTGGFRVCWSQGINIRKVDDEAAAAIASVDYRGNDFEGSPRLYTAWDNLKDGEAFFHGVDTLERAGVPAYRIMAYMLVGFDRRETWERIRERFDRMVERKIKPYPMVYDPVRGEKAAPPNDLDRDRLKDFQRWVVTAQYRKGVQFSDYSSSIKRGARPLGQASLFGGA